jgi:hypothetical protein
MAAFADHEASIGRGFPPDLPINLRGSHMKSLHRADSRSGEVEKPLLIQSDSAV